MGPHCEKPGCTRKVYRKKFCQTCWKKQRPPETRVCTTEGCGQPLQCRGLCKSCYKKLTWRENHEARERALAKHRRRYSTDEAFRERMRELHRACNHGFPVGLSDLLRALQEGKCAICTRTMGRGKGAHTECADHCHNSKEPRGLLCSSCNKSLGIYEKHQRPLGLRWDVYEQYLSNPPASRVRVAE